MCPHDPERETAFSWRAGMCESSGCGHQRIPLYTAPPARKPLTDAEIADLWDGHVVPVFGKNGINPIVFARAIERAHGINEK
jgi:hypothetical protein